LHRLLFSGPSALSFLAAMTLHLLLHLQARALSDGGTVLGSVVAAVAPAPASRQSPHTLASILRTPAGDPAYASPSPLRLYCTVGARLAAQGGRALALPVYKTRHCAL
jgi:hypothetical protein